MKILKKIFFGFAIIGQLLSCSSSSSDGDDNIPDDDGPGTSVTPPSAATLVFPEDNTECNEGVVLDETTSTVTFRWNASQNTDSYSVNLTNLNTDETTVTNALTNEAPINLERGAPYAWFVISRATGVSESATSATFRFYNEGPGVENYAPFPAEAVAPSRGATIDFSSTLTLEWTASDVDEDIALFEVLFGTDSANLASQGETSSTSLDVSIPSNGVYFWQVITSDEVGNSSNSEIFEFRVN